jgi:site-specific DNA recombinase
VRRKLTAVRQRVTPNQSPPTPEWIDAKLLELSEVLNSGGPASAVALRNLIGRITVTEMAPVHGKRKYFRGEFQVARGEVLNGLDLTVDAIEPRPTDRIVIDFVEPPSWSEHVEKVKEMYDAGLSFDEMMTKLNCPKSWPRKALTKWYVDRGLTPPDYSEVRARQASRSRIPELAAAAKELWDAGLLIQEIAERLDCDRTIARGAIQQWFTAHGLPMPDGRTRRKTLIRKTTRRSKSIADDECNNESTTLTCSDDRPEAEGGPCA